jgi:hypothetical protein
VAPWTDTRQQAWPYGTLQHAAGCAELDHRAGCQQSCEAWKLARRTPLFNEPKVQGIETNDYCSRLVARGSVYRGDSGVQKHVKDFD